VGFFSINVLLLAINFGYFAAEVLSKFPTATVQSVRSRITTMLNNAEKKSVKAENKKASVEAVKPKVTVPESSDVDDD
jgi:trans-aconitate methyltransferase